MGRSKAEQYRRRARECLDMACTLPPGAKRAILIDMAQTWLQLADQTGAAIIADAVEQSQPAEVVSQQQTQPNDDDKAAATDCQKWLRHPRETEPV